MSAWGKAPCEEAAARAPVARIACGPNSRQWILVATILGSSMAFIDGSVVTVALPAIQRSLGASVPQMQWVMNGYLLLLGALMLVGGAAGDRFGRRHVFAVGIALFTLASIGCGLAPNAAILIAARALQGLGGALLVPSSLALISAAFDERERGRAIGTWAGFSALTTALGPVIGGWAVDAISWRAIFFINLPIAAATLAIVLWRVPDGGDRTGSAVDWRGGLLSTAGLGAIAYGLTAAADRSWTGAAVVAPLVAGALLLAGFVQRERRAAAPMVPLGLFRSRVFSGANGMTLMLYFALSGMLFFLPFNLISLQGYSAAAAGTALLPLTLILGGLSRWFGGLQDRYGSRLPLTLGPAIAAVGFALLALPDIGSAYWTTFFPALIVLGLGMSVSVAPLTTTVMGAVSAGYAGAASGINNAISRIAGMLAIAVLGTVAVAVFGAALATRLQALGVGPETRAAMMAQIPRLADASAPPHASGATQAALQQALDRAFLTSFRVVMLITAAMALASAACAGLTLAPRSDRGASGPSDT